MKKILFSLFTFAFLLILISISSSDVNAAPVCQAFGVTTSKGQSGLSLSVSSDETLSFSLQGDDNTSTAAAYDPEQLEICWAVAGQSASYYQQRSVIESCAYTSTAKFGYTATQTFEDYVAGLPTTYTTGLSGDPYTNGLIFYTRVHYYANATTQWCTTSPGYNGGAGALQTTALTNSTCNEGCSNITVKLANQLSCEGFTANGYDGGTNVKLDNDDDYVTINTSLMDGGVLSGQPGNAEVCFAPANQPSVFYLDNSNWYCGSSTSLGSSGLTWMYLYSMQYSSISTLLLDNTTNGSLVTDNGFIATTRYYDSTNTDYCWSHPSYSLDGVIFSGGAINYTDCAKITGDSCYASYISRESGDIATVDGSDSGSSSSSSGSTDSGDTASSSGSDAGTGTGGAGSSAAGDGYTNSILPKASILGSSNLLLPVVGLIFMLAGIIVYSGSLPDIQKLNAKTLVEIEEED